MSPPAPGSAVVPPTACHSAAFHQPVCPSASPPAHQPVRPPARLPQLCSHLRLRQAPRIRLQPSCLMSPPAQGSSAARHPRPLPHTPSPPSLFTQTSERLPQPAFFPWSQRGSTCVGWGLLLGGGMEFSSSAVVLSWWWGRRASAIEWSCFTDEKGHVLMVSATNAHMQLCNCVGRKVLIPGDGITHVFFGHGRGEAPQCPTRVGFWSI